ncbi:MAG: HAD family phosphatase [Marinilabiliaceae bacterium]|nr:HAD family phosphatase [Marinilabiliaceae bacterium]
MNTTIENAKLLIFDLGNVMIDIDLQASIKGFHYLGFDDIKDNISASHAGDGFMGKFETGDISVEEFYDEVRKYCDCDFTDDAIANAWNAMIGEFPQERVRLVEKLKEKQRVVLLSNTNELHRQAFDALADGYISIDLLFHRTYYSHELHMAKPDAQIFLSVLAEEGVKPEEACFFDDSDLNLQAARKLGIHAFKVDKQHDILSYFK